MNELEQAVEVVDSELDQIAEDRVQSTDFKWLTDKLKGALADSIDKAAKGIEIKKHNDMIIKLSGILKGDTEKYGNVNVREVFTSRKTKKGEAFYGYSHELYNAVRGATTNGLAEL